MKRYNRSVIMILVCLTLLLSGCRRREAAVRSVTEAPEVLIPVVLTIDPASGEKLEEALVDEFNETYQGKYRLDVEWVTETTADYRMRMKMLNVKDKLPAILTEIPFTPSFYQLLINEERIVDLEPYFEQDEEWKEAVDEEMLQNITEGDGDIYFGTNGSLALSGVGIYWNKELFAQAGISTFPETWDQFWECCERLETAGITPLALHTEGTGWAPMLLATAYVGSQEGGITFMEETSRSSFDNQYGRDMTAVLKRLFDYSSDDGLYRDFDVAFESFTSGEAAMIPNGYWMIQQMEDEHKERTGFSAFPENAIIASPRMSGWCVAAGYNEEITAGAVEFLKFRAIRSNRIWGETLDNEEEPLLLDYKDVIDGERKVIPNYQVTWNSILQEEVLSRYLPELIKNELEDEEFIGYLNESIERYNKENFEATE